MMPPPMIATSADFEVMEASGKPKTALYNVMNRCAEVQSPRVAKIHIARVPIRRHRVPEGRQPLRSSECSGIACLDIPTQHLVNAISHQPGIFVQSQVHEKEIVGDRERAHGGPDIVRSRRQRMDSE